MYVSAHGPWTRAFFDGAFRFAPDMKHSAVEDRFIAVGRNHADRPMFVAFTLRMVGGQLLVRPVSARYMHRKEMQAYERQEKGPQAPEG